MVAVSGARATVETQRLSACEGCHKATEGEGCSVCTLMGGNRALRAEAENPIGARVGDRVLIESRTSRMLWYAALVFLCPIVLALLAYVLASALSLISLWQTLFPLFAFVGTFVGVFVYSKSVQKKRCDIVITAVLGIDG